MEPYQGLDCSYDCWAWQEKTVTEILPGKRAQQAAVFYADNYVADADFNPTCCAIAISMISFIGDNPQHTLRLMRAPAPGPEQPQGHADLDSQTATQLYQDADTAASLQGCCSSVDDDRCTGVEAVAEAVMQKGFRDEEGRAVQLMKPFLPAALLVLTRARDASRYLGVLGQIQMLQTVNPQPKVLTSLSTCQQSVAP